MQLLMAWFHQHVTEMLELRSHYLCHLNESRNKVYVIGWCERAQLYISVGYLYSGVWRQMVYSVLSLIQAHTLFMDCSFNPLYLWNK